MNYFLDSRETYFAFTAYSIIEGLAHSVSCDKVSLYFPKKNKGRKKLGQKSEQQRITSCIDLLGGFYFIKRLTNLLTFFGMEVMGLKPQSSG